MSATLPHARVKTRDHFQTMDITWYTRTKQKESCRHMKRCTGSSRGKQSQSCRPMSRCTRSSRDKWTHSILSKMTPITLYRNILRLTCSLMPNLTNSTHLKVQINKRTRSCTRCLIEINISTAKQVKEKKVLAA